MHPRSSRHARRILALAAVTAALFVGVWHGAHAQLAKDYKLGDRVKFPEAYAKDVLYTTVDRADIKQYRELYGPAAALEAAKKGAALPDGTVLTLVQFKAQLDADGNPTKDANGRLLKGDLVGYVAMEKRKGWGEAVPAEFRNGDWEYQAFKADKTVNDKANLKGCFECHKPFEKQDFVFSWEKMGGPKR